jgi:hypothetical protein
MLSVHSAFLQGLCDGLADRAVTGNLEAESNLEDLPVIDTKSSCSGWLNITLTRSWHARTFVNS